jgi:guanylate kinase
MYRFIALSAPSGAGKTTIAKRLIARNKELVISVSATTRPKRPGEKQGVDYFFMSVSDFESNIRDRNFLEYEQVHGNYYGTLRPVVEDLIRKGKRIVFDIDVKGALSIRKAFPNESLLIFIQAPSIEELKKRLRKRRSESEKAMELRFERIDFEISQSKYFDHIIINDSLEHTVEKIESLIRSDVSI